MHDIVYRILSWFVSRRGNVWSGDETYLSCNITIRIEEAERVVRATVDSNTDFSDIIVCVWCCLCASERAFVFRIANIELVVVRSVWLQILRLNLWHRQLSISHYTGVFLRVN